MGVKSLIKCFPSQTQPTLLPFLRKQGKKQKPSGGNYHHGSNLWSLNSVTNSSMTPKYSTTLTFCLFPPNHYPSVNNRVNERSFHTPFQDFAAQCKWMNLLYQPRTTPHPYPGGQLPTNAMRNELNLELPKQRITKSHVILPKKEDFKTPATYKTIINLTINLGSNSGLF